MGAGAEGAAPRDSLAATSAAPWNPDRALHSRRAWERVVLIPGQVLSLPLSAAGYVADRTLRHFEQNSSFLGGSRGPRVIPVRALQPDWSRLGDRTGLGAAAGVRSPLMGGALKTQVTARFAGTILGYNSTQVGVTGEPFALQYGYDWRPQDQFAGVGPGASRDELSSVATQREFVRGTLRWAWKDAGGLKPPGTVVTIWGGPRSQVTRTGREDGRVSFETRFPELGAATLNRRDEHFVYGASFARDARGGRPHWGHGNRLLLSAERYDVPLAALALHDGRLRGAQFTRYVVESELGTSFMRDPRSVRLLLRAVDQHPGSGGGPLQISDLATLGGREGLRGFTPGRFHDLDLVLGRLTYLFPILRGLEVDLHTEAGAVYHDIWKDAKLNTLESSVGFAVRARSALRPIASAGLDFSRESIRVRLALGGLE